MITDNSCSFFSMKFQILWNSGDHRSRENIAMLTNPCARKNGDIAADPGVITNLHIIMDHGEGIYLHIFTNAGIRMYDDEVVVHGWNF